MDKASIDRTDEYQAKGIVGSGDAVVETADGIEIRRGVGDLFIPREELLKVEKIGADMAAEVAEAGLDEHVVRSGSCQNCRKPFLPRIKSGGKPQKFCSTECRRAADAERKANAPNADQRENAFVMHPGSAAARHIGLAPAAADPDMPDIETYTGSLARQYGIRVSSMKDGESCLGNDVQLEQEGDHGWDESSKITVNAENVVRLCRMMLWSCGFRHISITHSADGVGWVDLHDGDQPGRFY